MKPTSIVLAGGKSLRFGRNKALETICGKSLIECVVQRLKPITSQILIVTSKELVDLPVAGKTEILTDVYPNKGPLGGIYTGLLAAKSSRSIVVACDMPFLNIKLLSYMVKLSRGVDAVIPRLGEELLQPLHAVYSKNCLSSIKTHLEQDQLQIRPFLNTVRVRYVEQVECQRLDPELLSFFNINYKSDLDQALALAAKSKC